jgi:hypothetical protein
MERSYWKSDTPKIITIFADPDSTINVYYKKRGSSVNFVEISDEPLYRGDGIWEIETSFPIGEYIIKTVVDDDLVVMGLIEVVSAAEFSHTVNQELIRQDIESMVDSIMNGIDGIKNTADNVKRLTEIINGRI